MDDFVDSILTTSNVYKPTTCRWARPKLPDYKPEEDKLVFQQLDIDHYIGTNTIAL